jgi:glycosyltransferase involved in cell wall biosynthesis
MKILYHHRTRSKDGQAVHIEELIAALRRLGHEVVVVAPPAMDGAEFGDDAGLVATLKRMLPHALYELLEVGYSAVAYRRLRRAYLEHRPDVLYERYNLFLLAGVWLKRRYGIKLLLEVNAPLAEERRKHDGLALSGFARRCEAATWRAADHVLAVTGELKRMIEAAGVPAERVAVIPNGVDRVRFAPPYDLKTAKARLGLDGRTVLGFTGFVRAWHGLDRVIDLIAAAGPASPLHLLMVGEGPVREELMAQAQRLGVADKVTMTGVVPREKVAEYVAAFDVALQPAAVPYASPLKLFEYMALGRSIVAPRQSNITEILEDGRTALLFDPAQPQDFRDKIQRLIDDEALRLALGRAAAASIEERGLTWDSNARRVADLAKAAA